MNIIIWYPELVEDACCAVSRPAVMTVILDVISENIPELQALNLDHNMLSVTETLASLPRKAPNLQILYLGKNRVSCIFAFPAVCFIIIFF